MLSARLKGRFTSSRVMISLYGNLPCHGGFVNSAGLDFASATIFSVGSVIRFTMSLRGSPDAANHLPRGASGIKDMNES